MPPKHLDRMTASRQSSSVELLPADRDAASKAFDIAFRGDTDGIDEAMAALFAAHRIDPTTAANTLRDAKFITPEQYNRICANIRAKAVFRGEGVS